MPGGHVRQALQVAVVHGAPSALPQAGGACHRGAPDSQEQERAGVRHQQRCSCKDSFAGQVVTSQVASSRAAANAVAAPACTCGEAGKADRGWPRRCSGCRGGARCVDGATSWQGRSCGPSTSATGGTGNADCAAGRSDAQPLCQCVCVTQLGCWWGDDLVDDERGFLWVFTEAIQGDWCEQWRPVAAPATFLHVHPKPGCGASAAIANDGTAACDYAASRRLWPPCPVAHIGLSVRSSWRGDGRASCG